MTTTKSLSEQLEGIYSDISKARSGAQRAEMHISSLLGFLDSVRARFPEALSEQTVVVCQSIAREYNQASFQEKKR